MAKKICLTKLQVWGQFLASIIVEAIIIIFYKTIYNVGLAFNSAITDFFKPICAKMLTFLFIIIQYNIKQYQSGVKIVRLFNRKTA